MISNGKDSVDVTKVLVFGWDNYSGLCRGTPSTTTAVLRRGQWRESPQCTQRRPRCDHGGRGGGGAAADKNAGHQPLEEVEGPCPGPPGARALGFGCRPAAVRLLSLKPAGHHRSLRHSQGNYRARAGPAGPLQMEARALPSSAAWAGTVKDPPCKAVSGLTGRTV